MVMDSVGPMRKTIDDSWTEKASNFPMVNGTKDIRQGDLANCLIGGEELNWRAADGHLTIATEALMLGNAFKLPSWVLVLGRRNWIRSVILATLVMPRAEKLQVEPNFITHHELSTMLQLDTKVGHSGVWVANKVPYRSVCETIKFNWLAIDWKNW